MVRRLLAAVFAAFVLLVAFTIRDGGDGPMDPGGTEGRLRVADGSAGDDAYDVFDDDEGFVLLCIEDLGALCRDTFDLFGFAVRVEPAWTTVARLQGGGELGADVWLTVLPFPELAEAAPGTAGGTTPELSAPTPVLARSPIAVTGTGGAVDALAAACPDATVLLPCLVGPSRAGPVVLRDPATSAVGALALTALAIDLGADPDLPWSGDPAIIAALRSAVADGRRSQAPVEDAVRIGGTAVALSVEAELIGQVVDLEFEERDATLATRGLRYPLDVRAVEVVAVATTDFPRPRDLETMLRSRTLGFSFERHGWVAEGRTASFLDAAIFDARPAVRTDLPWPPGLVRDLREVVAP